MAIVLNPITLPLSKFLSTMTTLIGQVRFKETLSPSSVVNALVSSVRNEKVDYGKGIVHTFKLGLQPVQDLTETSTVLEVTKANIAQETILIDQYKKIPLSISEILSRDAVLSGSAVSTFAAFVMSLLDATAQFYLFDVANNLYQSWTPGQSTQTVEVRQIDTSALTGVELTSALTWNSNEIAKVMRKTINNMRIKNSKYTDVATYTDVNTGETANVVSCIEGDNLKVAFNDQYYTEFLANSMASLYHPDKVGDMIPAGQFILLPTDAMTTDNANTIAWVSSTDKFSLADFYRLTISFTDASNLYTNYFLHMSYGAGVFTYAPAVKFVATTITSAEAGV